MEFEKYLKYKSEFFSKIYNTNYLSVNLSHIKILS